MVPGSCLSCFTRHSGHPWRQVLSTGRRVCGTDSETTWSCSHLGTDLFGASPSAPMGSCSQRALPAAKYARGTCSSTTTHLRSAWWETEVQSGASGSALTADGLQRAVMTAAYISET